MMREHDVGKPAERDGPENIQQENPPSGSRSRTGRFNQHERSPPVSVFNNVYQYSPLKLSDQSINHPQNAFMREFIERQERFRLNQPEDLFCMPMDVLALSSRSEYAGGS